MPIRNDIRDLLDRLAGSYQRPGLRESIGKAEQAISRMDQGTLAGRPVEEVQRDLAAVRRGMRLPTTLPAYLLGLRDTEPSPLEDANAAIQALARGAQSGVRWDAERRLDQHPAFGKLRSMQAPVDAVKPSIPMKGGRPSTIPETRSYWEKVIAAKNRAYRERK